MSIPLLALLLVGAVTLSVGLFWVVHRRVGRERFLADTTRGGAIIGLIGTSYAVILAFVVLISLQNYDEASQGGEQEAAAVSEMWRGALLLPGPERASFQGALVCYGRAVAEDEWDRMEDESRSSLVEDWVARMGGLFTRMQVASPKQQVAFSHVLTLNDKRSDGRRDRLDAATPFIPVPLWFVLIVGALTSIGFVVLFKDAAEAFAVQAAMIAGVTIIITSGLAMIWFLDHPYQDSSGSLQPDEMRVTLALIAPATPRAPCDVAGRVRVV
jgi:hypothetical protein